jgi:hypothetical protein
MSSPISPQELARLRQAMFLGLARQPLPVPESLQPLLASAPEREPTLDVLALAGQRQRFQRPVVERCAEGIPDPARRLHEDQRPIIPEPARRLLLRLAKGIDKSLADAAVRAAVRRVTRSGFRLHPFDLPRLMGHLKGDARCLDLAERAYLALADAPEKADAPSLLHADITTENWTEFPKGHRVAFLREQRRSDPAAARSLLEGVFKSETAAVRTDLLAALEVGLGPDDLPFLESVASDRSQAVRDLAARLIANVPATPAYAARLAEAARCFTRACSGLSGMLSRAGLASAAVAFAPPKRPGALRNLFDGFSAAEVAAAAGLTVHEIVAALPADDATVLDALFSRAVRDGDEATMVELQLAHIDDEGYSLMLSMQELALFLTSSLSVEAGSRLLGSAAWRGELKEFNEAKTLAALKDSGPTLIWTAAVLPPELQPAFQEAIAPLPPVATRSARDFSDLVLALGALELRKGEAHA